MAGQWQQGTGSAVCGGARPPSVELTTWDGKGAERIVEHLESAAGMTQRRRPHGEAQRIDSRPLLASRICTGRVLTTQLTKRGDKTRIIGSIE